MSDLIERFEDLIGRLKSVPSGVGIGLQDRQLLDKVSARICELEAERDELIISRCAFRSRAENAEKREDVLKERAIRAQQCKPLLAKIAAIPLWRDTYSDGPDMIVTGILGKSTDGFTPDDVRLARAIVKPSGDFKEKHEISKI